MLRCRTVPALFACLCPLIAQQAAQGPLTALPYTPSLDVRAMDRAVAPCTDFHHYACGNWIKNNPIPAGIGR